MTAPLSAPSRPAPAEVTELPPIVVTGKRDENAEVRELMKEMLKEGPELVEKMTPEELEEYRDLMHTVMVGGGSAKTLVGAAEMLHDATKAVREAMAEPDAPDPEEDIHEDIPVTYGQVPEFSELMKRMMCRAADQQLSKETAADATTEAQTRNSPEHSDAAKNLAEDRQLRQRLDQVCKPPGL